MVPPLVLESVAANRPPPQAARSATIVWMASATGGVGERTFEFVLSDGKEERRVQEGPFPIWSWRPEEGGRFRVKAVVRDAAGNRAESKWSGVYEVAPPLALESVVADRPPPQPPRLAEIGIRVSSSGGVGPHAYEFIVSDGKEERRVHEGFFSRWKWRPEAAGEYRMKVAVRDRLGNRVESGWSFPYAISNAMVYTVPIAVLPVENLSGATTPLGNIREYLIKSLKNRGFSILDDISLEKFMSRHRVRYTGGVEKATAKAFEEETGAGAVLVTSLELYDENVPPKIAVTSRLVATGESPLILWMDSVGMAGDDSPGFLDLGLVEDPPELLEKAMRSLADSLAGYVAGDRGRDLAGSPSERFRPRMTYRSPDIDAGSKRTMAVLPFFNQSLRKYAGEIMKLHFVREMSKLGSIQVIEPGMVRQELLSYRIIMEEGVSLAQADVLLAVLNADLLLTGEVLEYQDYRGPEGVPVVDFSLALIDRKSRKVVWSSRSSNKGTDGVYFFDLGRERTANEIAAEMARMATGEMWQ